MKCGDIKEGSLVFVSLVGGLTNVAKVVLVDADTISVECKTSPLLGITVIHPEHDDIALLVENPGDVDVDQALCEHMMEFILNLVKYGMMQKTILLQKINGLDRRTRSSSRY